MDILVAVLSFGGASLVIGWSGVRLATAADKLADRTGLGEAIVGAVLLGASTSLAGIVASVAAAAKGHPELAVSNALGGIAAQTAFLALADIAYRKANLEHAAASPENLIQGTLLVTLLTIPLLAIASPEVTGFGIHPASLLLIAAYFMGLRLLSQTRSMPMWHPRSTPETRPDKPARPQAGDPSLVGLWFRFTALGFVVAAAGYIVARAAISIASHTGLSETVVGALLTAVATSLPELVTSVAAVRAGALTLAVGGIMGGNTFDVLFLSFSDFAYRGGSIYHAISERQVFFMALTMLLTGILLLGLLRREKHGIANIGFESFLVLVLYLAALAWLFSVN